MVQLKITKQKFSTWSEWIQSIYSTEKLFYHKTIWRLFVYFVLARISKWCNYKHLQKHEIQVIHVKVTVATVLTVPKSSEKYSIILILWSDYNEIVVWEHILGDLMGHGLMKEFHILFQTSNIYFVIQWASIYNKPRTSYPLPET